MAENGRLTPKKRRAIAALLQARTLEAAAELAGVGERTLYRWLQDDSFVQALRAAEGEMIGEAVRGLIADMKANFDVMRGIRDDPTSSKGEKLRAAKALDASLLKWRLANNIELRFVELEDIVNGLTEKVR